MVAEDNLQKIEKLLFQSKKRVEEAKNRSDILKLDDNNMGGEKTILVLIAKLFSGSDIKKQIEDLKLNKEQAELLLKLQTLSKENLEAAKELLQSDEGKKAFKEIFGNNNNMAIELTKKQLTNGEAIKVVDILDASPHGKVFKDAVKEVEKQVLRKQKQ
jgi:hypothetical protein